MSIRSYLFSSRLKQKAKNVVKSILFPPEQVFVSVDTIFQKLKGNEFTNFLQIGSNDGMKNDPLFEFVLKNELRGILVEPLQQNFQKLVANYRDAADRLVFEMAGVSNQSGTFNYYFIKDISSDEPDWYDQVGSFDKETFIKNIEVVPGLESRIGVQEIRCYTVAEILSRNGMATIDLLHLDTEGYDYRILKSMDLNIIKPKIILFETDWMTQFELKELKKQLKRYQYEVFFDGIDCIAVKGVRN